MKRLTAVLIFVFSFLDLSAQEEFSFQFNGGIISPLNSHSGLSGGLQINYNIKENLDIYFITGYSKWHKNILQEDDYYHSENEVYDENNHRLIPFEFGARYFFTENKLFKTFIDAEIGLCYLIYDKYDVMYDEGTEEFYVAGLEENDVEQFLLGMGIGIGVSRKIGENFNLFLGGKIKTIVNSDYNDFELLENLYFITYFGIGFDL